MLYALNVYTYDAVEIPFDYMMSGYERHRTQSPFGHSHAARDELLDRINTAVPDANLPSEEERKRPSFSLRALRDRPVQDALCEVMYWAFDEARRAQQDPRADASAD